MWNNCHDFGIYDIWAHARERTRITRNRQTFNNLIRYVVMLCAECSQSTQHLHNDLVTRPQNRCSHTQTHSQMHKVTFAIHVFMLRFNFECVRGWFGWFILATLIRIAHALFSYMIWLTDVYRTASLIPKTEDSEIGAFRMRVSNANHNMQ